MDPNEEAHTNSPSSLSFSRVHIDIDDFLFICSTQQQIWIDLFVYILWWERIEGEEFKWKLWLLKIDLII